MTDTDDLVWAWRKYLRTVSWQQLIQDKISKPSGCGLIYELGNLLNRPNEDASIADMRQLDYTEPHFHPYPDVEVYFVLQGSGLFVVGGEKQLIAEDGVVVIPPDTAHFTIPQNLVLVVVNTPPFKPDRYIPLIKTDLKTRFDYSQYRKLAGL